MKILCITGSFLPSIGGMQFSTHQTLLGLSELGVDVTLVCPHKTGDVEFDKNILYEIIRNGKGGYLTEIKNLFLVNKLYENNQYNEVIIMGHFGEVAFGIFKDFLSFKPIVLAAGTRLPFKNSAYKMMIRNKILCRAYSSAKKIIAISDATIDFICKYCATEKEKFQKIPRLIDDDLWRFKEKISNDVFTLVTFGRFEKQKNIQEILKILSFVKNRGYEFRYLLIGDGDYKNELEKLVKILNLEDNVEFLGYKTQKEVIDILHSCDLHILLSKAHNGLGETFGRVYAEAGFIKVPSIGFKTSGVVEAVKDGYSGFLYEFNELNKIESKIIELMKNKELLNQLSQNAYNYSVENFSKSVVANKIKKYILES